MEFPEGKFVDCAGHGRQRPAFVCCHLVEADPAARGLGFFQPSRVDLSEWDAYAAWCSRCDAVLMANGGEWNTPSEAFARPRVICLGCFRDLHSRHALSDRHGVPP